MALNDTLDMLHNRFVPAMAAKLANREGKNKLGTWALKAYVDYLKIEVAELEAAIDYETPADIMAECVDVSNYALLLYKHVRTLAEERDAYTLVDKLNGRS